MLNKKVLCKLGYIISYKKINIFRFNFSKLFVYLHKYRGVFEIREDIYLKFFFLYYFYMVHYIMLNPTSNLNKN